MKAAPAAYYAIPPLTLADVDAVAFRKLRLRQYRQVRRLMRTHGAAMNSKGLRFLQYVCWIAWLDSRAQ